MVQRGRLAWAAVVKALALLGAGSGVAAERIAVRLNRTEFALGEPVFCLLRIGEPGAIGTLRRVRCEYRVLDEAGRVLGIASSRGGEGWCQIEARPLVRSRRELIFTLWRVGCGGPFIEEPELITGVAGKYTLEVRASWWVRLVEVPWVVADPVRFEVREPPEDASKGREFADLAFRVLSEKASVGAGPVREFFGQAPTAYKPYAAWLLLQVYRSSDLLEGKAPRAHYGDLAEALKAMRGTKVADFPNEFDEGVRFLELLQAGLARDLERYRKSLQEYSAVYGYCGLLDLAAVDPDSGPAPVDFHRRAARLAALSEEEAKDTRTKIERAGAIAFKGKPEAALAYLVRVFEGDAKARAAAIECLGDKKLPREVKGTVIRALAQTRFPERDTFVRECAMGKYGDLRWPAVQSLKFIDRRDAERAVLANLEDLLDGYFAPAPVFDVAVELKILSARPLLKALADEGNQAARRAYEELEKAAGGGGSKGASGKESETR